jgi:site-specific recombinase XerD
MDASHSPFLSQPAACAESIIEATTHDLRGTAATNFIRAGLDLSEVATILGWKKGKAEEIAARYMTRQGIGLAMVEKLRRNARKRKL